MHDFFGDDDESVCLSLSKDNLRFLNNYNESFIYETKVNFLRQHKGLRPGSVHMILSTSGAGKSTMLRTIKKDFVFNNPEKTIHLHLSEDSLSSAALNIAKTVNDECEREAIFGMSEYKWHKYQNKSFIERGWLDKIRKAIERRRAELFIFDNITTSRFYITKTPSEQDLIALELKGIAQEYNIPVIIVAHTGSSYHGGTINQEHIRGAKLINSIAEYYYIIRRVRSSKGDFYILRIEKHRNHLVEVKYFSLQMDMRNNYILDNELSDAEYDEILLRSKEVTL